MGDPVVRVAAGPGTVAKSTCRPAAWPSAVATVGKALKNKIDLGTRGEQHAHGGEHRKRAAAHPVAMAQARDCQQQAAHAHPKIDRQRQRVQKRTPNPLHHERSAPEVASAVSTRPGTVRTRCRPSLRTSNHAAAATPTTSRTIGSAPEIKDSCPSLCATHSSSTGCDPPAATVTSRLQQSGRCRDLSD